MSRLKSLSVGGAVKGILWGLLLLWILALIFSAPSEKGKTAGQKQFEMEADLMHSHIVRLELRLAELEQQLRDLTAANTPRLTASAEAAPPVTEGPHADATVVRMGE